MQLVGIDTNLVIALSALLTHRNVTRAGKEVGLGQSSMSHALSRLRAHFDDPLLVSVGRELILTERAKALVEPVADAVAHLERVFIREQPFDPRTSRRVFRIAATDNLELFVLPRLAALLKKEAPCVDIRVCALMENWATSLQRGDIDLKLGRMYPTPALIESQELSVETFTCVTRRGHPARGKLTLGRYLELDHLLIAPTAGVSAEPDGLIDAALKKQGLRRRVAMSIPHFLVAPFVVASSDLVLTAPTCLVTPFVKLLDLREQAVPMRIPGYKLSQAWAVRTRDDAAQRWLREAVVTAFAQRHTAP